MTAKLKPVSEQVIVITGASSGIGLATAYKAAADGAKVVLASRNGPELDAVVARITERGGTAIAVPTDVSRREEVERLAEKAIATYGGFDTWVNDAGLSIFGRIEEIADEDHRQLFEINFWGLVYGSTVAVRHLKQNGGAIINLGSVASDMAFPIQGMYCASKHAIKGFTDALRMEIEEAGQPISVTLIKPSAINTPFAEHAKNYLDQEPKLPPPLYAPEDVADAIVYAAAHGGRDYYIGGGGKLMSTLNKHIPAAIDWMAAKMIARQQGEGEPIRPREGSLHEHAIDGHVHGDSPHLVRRSTYTKATLNPVTSAALIIAAGLVGMTLASRKAHAPTRWEPSGPNGDLGPYDTLEM